MTTSLAQIRRAEGMSLLGAVLVGVLAAVFFSSTWIINRNISLTAGPWQWNAILRYPMVLAILVPWLAVRRGDRGLNAALRVFLRRPGYWTLAGSLGCGVFYLGICFAGDRAPGWVLATTWQVSILLSPLVLRFFGLKVPMRGLALMILVFVGAMLVNVSQIRNGGDPMTHWGAAAALLFSAIAYPTGNQLLNRARHIERGHEDETARLVSDPILGLFVMSLGSVPFWIVVLVVTQPALPETSQVLQIAIVAVSSGVIATALFFWARNATGDPYVIAAVDATQSMELVLAVLGEALLLGGAWPGKIEWIGIVLVIGGVVGLALRPNPAPPTGLRGEGHIPQEIGP